jgi:internalin A
MGVSGLLSVNQPQNNRKILLTFFIFIRIATMVLKETYVCLRIRLTKSIMGIALLLNLIIPCNSAIAAPQKPTPINFLDWCLRKNQLPRPTQHTINMMLKEAGTPICDRAAQKLSNVEYLYLNNKQISDLRPLSSLVNLQVLHLSENQIRDIRPLSSLINLKGLYLHLNQVNDIGPLSTLTNLWLLNLWRNQVVDIKPLSNLTKLADLDLSDNRIINLKPLSALTDLSKLVLKGNLINDLKPLSSLKNLTYLNLSNSPKLIDKTCPFKPESICFF